MRESIEIEKHSAIDQEGKPLDSTWQAFFTMRNYTGLQLITVVVTTDWTALLK